VSHTLACVLGCLTDHCNLTRNEQRVVEHAANIGANTNVPANLPQFAAAPYVAEELRAVERFAESVDVVWDHVKPHALAAYNAAMEAR
jgi:hypothetical protein